MTVTYFFPDVSPVLKLRGWLVRPAFKRCGKNFKIAHNAQITFTSQVSIGDNVFIAHGAWIHGLGQVTLQDEVSMGPYAIILSSAHKQGPGSLRFAPNELAPVTLCKGAYVGSHSVILKGVTIGENALITPGTVVATDIPASAMATGNPARAIMRPIA
ncbi:MAG: acyltransferase [Phycisphaerae bacterium]|nr:acyltransferase [Phycisphaerae bacterium]